MARSVLLLFVGALAGGAAIDIFYRPAGIEKPVALGAATGAVPQPIAEATAPDSIAAGDPRANNSTSPTAVRVAAYLRALQATDVLDLETMIDFAAARPRSRARDLELKALLGRLAELDPQRAVDFAQSAYLETSLLVQAFEALASTDADAAIVEVASVTPPARQRKVALAVLKLIGNNEQGVARLAAALPIEDTTSFEIDALLARAESNPVAALRDLIAVDRSGIQSLALSRLAEIAARKDPRAALAAADSIDDSNFRRSFQIQLLGGWAEIDPDSVFAYLETAESSLLSMSSSVFQAVARSDPDRLMAMIDRFPPAARNTAKSAVMQAVAESNPIDAISLLDTMPAGQEKERMLQRIAQSYGQQNPDLALAWVRSLTPPSDNAMRAVLQGIVRTDVDRAIDIMLTEFDNQDSAPSTSPTLGASLSFSMMFSQIASSGSEVARLADRLLESDNPQVSSMMSSVVTMWASRDSDAAMNWTLANADSLDSNVLASMAQRIAAENLDLAINALDRLSAEQRAGWINGLASQMARQDVNQAIGFIERYRGQPGYQNAFATVVGEMARIDPVRAAGMLRNEPASSTSMSAVFAISREWANRDPAAAGRWAVDEIGDDQMRTMAINNIASMWAQRDGEAAERWIFGLASGSVRDAAVDGYLSAAAQVGQFKPSLLEAYSSDEAGQRGASLAIIRMGRTDPEQAKRLAERYISDPAIRAQTQESLAGIGAVGSGIFISNGDILVLQ
jgi:hypothetical protein